MDIFQTLLSFLPLLADMATPVTSVIGGAAVVASVFVKPKSQYGRKLHTIINILGANFGKAKNGK